MKCLLPLLLPLLSQSFSVDAANLDHHTRSIVNRAIIAEGNLADTYDFAICGGGLAGLVLASRLTQNSQYTVLVLEAGNTGDDVRESIDVPGNAYYKSLLYTPYDWQYKTYPQIGLQNRVLDWPRGKGLGGSTIVNGLYLVRPSSLEAENWKGLLNGVDGSNLWGWSSLLDAMKKSEKFTPPTPDAAKAGNIQFEASSHGTAGPLQASYPGYIVPVVGNWTNTLANAGIPSNSDPNGGNGLGGFVTASTINPSNFSRSSARTAYIDPLPPRDNLHILPNATVTRLVFGPPGSSSGLIATGVEFAKARGEPRRVINVKKEVILAGGAIGSPQILFNSGVGARDVLTSAGVNVALGLPGVGQHLQDHISTAVVFNISAQTAASITRASVNSRLPDNFLSYINNAIGYVNGTTLLGGDAAQTLQSTVLANITNSTIALTPSTDDTVRAGYSALNTASAKLLTANVGQVELLLGLMGETLSIQAAIQHPFSHGHLWINSSDPFEYPFIDPAYLAHPSDIVILREGLKLARKIGQTDPLRQVVLSEIAPGPAIQTDADWDNWLINQVGTQYHPSCSCAMLPKELGGVVDPKLKVYGLANVRVADASVFPTQFAAHLMSVTYGLAEQAANIIRAEYGMSVTGAALDAKSGSNKPNTGPSKFAFSTLSGFAALLGATFILFASI